MKKLFLITISALFLLSGIALANDDPPKRGSFAGTSTTLTNTQNNTYIVSAIVWGEFDGTNEVSFALTVPAVESTASSYKIAKSTTCLNSLLYIDGDAAIRWEKDSVMTITTSSNGSTTNGYFVQTTKKPSER